MSAQSTNNQIVGLTISVLGSAMLAAEAGRQRAADRHRQIRQIHAHNAAVARARAQRRRNADAVAAQVALGESRMSRWLERVAR